MNDEHTGAGTLDCALKALMDYGLSALAIVLALPLFAVVAVAIKLDSRGPVIYRRRVVGRGGRPFDAFKFRTMAAEGDALLAQHPEWAVENRGGRKLRDDPRVTRVGRLLRRLSLNELPQLVNILRGEMSLVGPRMATPAELVGHGEWREALVRVKPGLTGPWQISGRDDLPLEERIRLDRLYVARRNILMDFRILAKTVFAVVRGKGAY
jgi:lipopolysaccharide/colanic/teichoic acid biosynthesis glycosyltransferase